MIAILTDIRSSHNVGSIFRTADAVGIEKLYLAGVTPGPRDRFGRPNQKLLKVALGAEGTVAWEHVKSATRLMDRLKKDGIAIWALEQAPNAEPIFPQLIHPKVSPLGIPRGRPLDVGWDAVALVVGNEIAGLSRAILKRADKIIQIPMYGKKESLNVAVAFGVAAYQIRATMRRS